MRRTVLALLLAAAALPVAASPAQAARSAAAAPALGVRLAACETGASVLERGVEFEGAMPGEADASVLSMRFDLEQRRGAFGVWRPITGASGFGRYERSEPGAAGFVYAKRVERLAVGTSYRVVVRFRWRDADGEVVKRATRTSAACRQPDLRPDLGVVGVRAGEALAGGRVRYLVQVRNDGATPVLGPLRLDLAIDGAALAPVLLATLAAGRTTEVAVDGPACASGGRVVAEVDSGDAVEERSEADNALAVPCA